MRSPKILTVAAILAVALAGCGGTAAATHSTSAPSTSRPVATAPAAPKPSKSLIQQQQAASGAAATSLARDNTARAAYEDYFKTLTWSGMTPAQLTALSKFTLSLKDQESPALYQAEANLSGLIVAYFIATKNVPTMAQIQAAAQTVETTP